MFTLESRSDHILFVGGAESEQPPEIVVRHDLQQLRPETLPELEEPLLFPESTHRCEQTALELLALSERPVLEDVLHLVDDLDSLERREQQVDMVSLHELGVVLLELVQELHQLKWLSLLHLFWWGSFSSLFFLASYYSSLGEMLSYFPLLLDSILYIYYFASDEACIVPQFIKNIWER